MSAVRKDAYFEGAIPLLVLERDLHLHRRFVVRDVEHPEQPVVEIPLGGLREGVGFHHRRIVDEPRGTLEACDGDFLLCGARGVVVELVYVYRLTAAGGDQRLHSLLVDEPDRLSLGQRRAALCIAEPDLKCQAAAHLCQGLVHLAGGQFHRGTIER